MCTIKCTFCYHGWVGLWFLLFQLDKIETLEIFCDVMWFWKGQCWCYEANTAGWSSTLVGSSSTVLKATPTSQYSSKENMHWTLQWHPTWIIRFFFSINCRMFRYSEITYSSPRQDLIAFGPKSIPRKDCYPLWKTVR